MTTEDASIARPFLTKVDVRGYGCVRDATLRLTRLHALIGPNDSGKSTLLRAIESAMRFAADGFAPRPSDAFAAQLAPLGNEVQGLARPTAHLGLEVSGGANGRRLGYEFFKNADAGYEERLLVEGEEKLRAPVPAGPAATSTALNFDKIKYLDELDALLGDCRMVHLDAAAMRRPSRLFTEVEAAVMERDGARLAPVYDTLLARGDDSYRDIAASVKALFPTVKRLGLRPVTADTKVFEVELTTGERVPVSRMSDGMLYYLAYAALEHMTPVSVLLLEEPEKGLHPSRIAEVMRVLRRVSTRTQVILATHSPLVVNELQGDEVTVVTRARREGTRVCLLKSTPKYEARAAMYSNGELWVSYANGVDEAPLLDDPARSPPPTPKPARAPDA
jgi:predicted ATPase